MASDTQPSSLPEDDSAATPPRRPRVLLIFPPHTRNTEPPLGLGLIAAFLREVGVPCRIVDLNAVTAPMLASAASPGFTRRSQRACAHVHDAIRLLREPAGYTEGSRYRSCVEFYAAALASASRGQPWSITPGDFTDSRVTDFSPEAAEVAWGIGRESPWIPCLEDTLGPNLEEFAPTMVGISLTYRSQFLPGLALGAWIRTHTASLTIAWGGAFLDSLPQQTLTWLSSVGPVVRGQGESGLASLLDIPVATDGPFREPCFDDLDLSLYFGPRRVIPLTTTRGCYWRRCAFCAESAMAYHADDRDTLFKRLEALAARHSSCLIHFTDNAIPPAVLTELARRGSPVPWWGFVRPTEHLADPDFVQAVARSGCVMLQLGFETPSPRLLERMRKGVDPALFPSILSNLRNAGIRSYVYLLFALPGETGEDRQSSLRFCAEHPPDFLNAAVFRLTPSAALAVELEHFGMAPILSDSHDRYLHLPDEGVLLPQIRRWLSRCFLKHPAIRPVISRTPRYYKSSHAPFL